MTASLRTYGSTTVVGGLGITAAGLVAAVHPDVPGGIWMPATGVAILLVTVGVVGLRQAVAGIVLARKALPCAVVTMALFGLGHFYAAFDEDTGIPLFSAFLLLSVIALTTAGVAILRAGIWSPAARALPLIVGLWPVTVAIGLALGDVPQFVAIACWGILWICFGSMLAGRWQDVRHDEFQEAHQGGRNH
jgi:hypothetical protein